MQYREYLTACGLSDRTINTYVFQVGRAIRWFELQGWDLVTATAVEVSTFVRTTTNSASNRRQLRTALTRYWELAGRDDPPVKSVRVPPKPRGHCRAVTETQARDLVKVSLGWWPNGMAVLLGMYLALRREEIASARWDRFDRPFEWYTVQGKRDVTATLPVHPMLRDELAERATAYPYLFAGSRKRAHVTPATVWGWVRDVGETVGIVDLQCHQLRHTAIATANDNTHDMRATQEFARHARPETTAIYTRVTSQRLTDLVAGLDYLH
jgi:integrase